MLFQENSACLTITLTLLVDRRLGHYFCDVNNIYSTLFFNYAKYIFQREGLSQYNKIYEFEADILGQKAQMVMTSVSGHLLALEFVGAYKHWQSCNPLSLFDAPVLKYCPENYEKIKVSSQTIAY